MLCNAKKNGARWPISRREKPATRVDSSRSAKKNDKRAHRKHEENMKQLPAQRNRKTACRKVELMHLYVPCNAKKIGESFPL
jgi:hypothetical protein